MLTHASLLETLPTSLSRASRPSERSCGCSQAPRTPALSLRCGTAGAGTRLGLSQTFTHCWGELESLCSSRELQSQEEEGVLGII